jgi:rhomboid protease GluP
MTRALPRLDPLALDTAPGRRIIPPMPPPNPPGETDGDAVPRDLAEAGTYPTAAAGFDHGLVVLAMGCPYWLLPFGGRYRLLVEPGALEEVRVQLECFDRESIGWPPPPPPRGPARRTEIATPLLWALAVTAAYCAQGRWPGLLEDSGALDAQAVFDRGEWWRIGTALFLHADVGHLVSNALSGIFAFSAVLSTLGRRRGWLLLALASLTGNLAVAALNYPGPYLSLGASTAIFAALGLLTGRAVRVVRQHRPERSWRPVVAPLAAGIVLLGLFGAGGIHIDVGAHAAGFAAGLAWGFCAGVAGRDPR